MTIEEKHHLNFEIYQRNRRYMCWGAMFMMLICTAIEIQPKPSRTRANDDADKSSLRIIWQI